MDSGGLGLVERRSRVRAAAAALTGLAGVLGQASDAELAAVMGEADAVCAAAAATRAVVAAEAVRRGVVAGAGADAHGWVREHAPSLRQGGAGPVARLAVQVAGAGRWGGSLAPDAAGGPDPATPLGIVWAGVKDGSVSPGLALTALAEVARLEPRLVPEAVPTVTGALVQLGVAWGPNQMRRLRPGLLARYGQDGELDEVQARLASVARLSAPLVQSGDLTQYQLWMTPQQAATLEAAIGPLSAPAPNQATGEADLRPAGQRRVEALTQVCRRSSGLDADRAGAEGAAGSSAALHVAVNLADLQALTGAGEVLGSSASGVLLSPEVLRQVACEAALVPYVLGTAGEELDWGRVYRLFTRAQRRRVWRRDRTCTFPGCTAPGSWAQLHHVRHWADGGATDIDNAALLCQRHHTLVHRRRLWAVVRATPDESGRHVTWDLADGSYDRHLQWLARQRAEHDPPPLTRTRLLELVADLNSADPHDPDDADAALAAHDLTLHANEQYWAQLRAEQIDHDLFDQDYATTIEAATAIEPATHEPTTASVVPVDAETAGAA